MKGKAKTFLFRSILTPPQKLLVGIEITTTAEPPTTQTTERPTTETTESPITTTVTPSQSSPDPIITTMTTPIDESLPWWIYLIIANVSLMLLIVLYKFWGKWKVLQLTKNQSTHPQSFRRIKEEQERMAA